MKKTISYEPGRKRVFAVQYDGKNASELESLLGDACEIIKNEHETIVKVHCVENKVKAMQIDDWAVMFSFAQVFVLNNKEFRMLFVEEKTENLTFDKALHYLLLGHCVTRSVYGGCKHRVICKQIPAETKGMLVAKLQSLPESARDLLIELPGTPEINYCDQFLIIDLDTCTATSWTPNGSDLLAYDWMLVR